MSTTEARPAGRVEKRGLPLRPIAVALAAAIALIYVLLWLDVLSLPGAETGDRGILGVAGGVFAVLTVLVAVVRRRAVLVAAAALQVLLAVMYLAVSTDRDPSFEVWGLTIRALSLLLLVALVGLLLGRGRELDRS